MLIGINVGAMTIDKLLASIKFFDELDATVSKNYKIKEKNKCYLKQIFTIKFFCTCNK